MSPGILAYVTLYTVYVPVVAIGAVVNAFIADVTITMTLVTRSTTCVTFIALCTACQTRVTLCTHSIATIAL